MLIVYFDYITVGSGGSACVAHTWLRLSFYAAYVKNKSYERRQTSYPSHNIAWMCVQTVMVTFGKLLLSP